MSKSVFIRKKCPTCGAKMKLSDNSNLIPALAYGVPILTALIWIIADLIFGGSKVAWIICVVIYLLIILVFITLNPLNDFKCSKCSYTE